MELNLVQSTTNWLHTERNEKQTKH